MTDKRRSHRLKMKLPASFEVKKLGGSHLSIATTLDISATGICLICNDRLENGSVVTVNVSLPEGDRVEIEAEVVWIKTAAAYGGKTEYHTGLRIKEPLTAEATKFVKFYAEKLLEHFKNVEAQ